MNPSARNQTLSKGGTLYTSKAGWYSLRYPRSWVAEDSEDCTTFSDPENGVGALQISAYETPTHQDSKDILVEFLSDNQIPLDETKLAFEKNEGRCTASYSYSQGPWFKRIWFVSESNRLLKDDTLITSAGMETKGIQFSTPPDFKLEQPSSERAAFMRNPEISLFVAVPDKRVDDKYLIDLSNVVSRILTEQDAFIWVIEPASDSGMSKYQINRGHTKGLNEPMFKWIT